MTDSGGTFDYYQIYIRNGDLVCAPFGNNDPLDPVLVFDSFKKRNQDVFGWWHVSCSYHFQETVKGTLFNSLSEQT